MRLFNLLLGITAVILVLPTSSHAIVVLPASSQQPIVIKFNLVAATDTPKGKAAELFAVRAAELTHGRVKIEVYPNGALYKTKEEIEALQLGAVQMLAPSLAKLAKRVGGVTVFDLRSVNGIAFGDLGFSVFVNTKFWERLPAEIRGQLEQAMIETTEMGYKNFDEQKAARVEQTVAPRMEAARPTAERSRQGSTQVRQMDDAYQRPPPRPHIPLEISEDVWKALETSEAYLNHPRQQPLRTRSSYESQTVYTGAKVVSLKMPPPKVESTTSEITPIGDRCNKHHQTSPNFAMDNYSCGSVYLGSIVNGKPSTVIKSLDQLQGSLFPMRLGARMSFRSQSADPSDSKYDSTTTSSCEVVSKGSAQELDSRLTGAAWKIRCQGKTIMPNYDNKMVDSSYDDYYLEDMGTKFSKIGAYNYNQSAREHVLPQAGTQTLMVTEGDYGSRTTKTYQYHHVAVGESQIAADATEWAQQNAEEIRQLVKKELQRERATFAREQAAREQQAAQAAQAERAKPANEPPTQAAQRPGSGIFGALMGRVAAGAGGSGNASMRAFAKGVELGNQMNQAQASPGASSSDSQLSAGDAIVNQLGAGIINQAATQIRSSGTTGSQIVGGALENMALQAGNSSSLTGAAWGGTKVNAMAEPLPNGSAAGGAACFSQLSGSWKHPVGGTWSFNGSNARLVLNSTNYGSAAQQITELAISSCDNNTMTYKIVRAALINTVDPSMAYDKTPANAPSTPQWSKTHQQAYAISGGSLKFGNYTYGRR
ncbi:MAG TPA: hypothetical protein DEQ20_00290 [Desulfobulbaceae bacterium]|nr:hypothetical protein [Desulfobulbaceae bacterium]